MNVLDLIKIANKLDELGFYQEADEIDELLITAAEMDFDTLLKLEQKELKKDPKRYAEYLEKELYIYKNMIAEHKKEIRQYKSYIEDSWKVLELLINSQYRSKIPPIILHMATKIINKDYLSL